MYFIPRKETKHFHKTYFSASALVLILGKTDKIAYFCLGKTEMVCLNERLTVI